MVTLGLHHDTSSTWDTLKGTTSYIFALVLVTQLIYKFTSNKITVTHKGDNVIKTGTYL